MSHKAAKLLASALFTFCVALAAAIFALHAYAGFAGTEAVFETLIAFALLVFPVSGVLIASRRPDNWIGWLFCAIGFFWLTLFLSSAYATVALDYERGSLPGAWVNEWVWIPAVATPVTYPLLLFPNGKPLGKRWALAAWTAAVATSLAVLITMTTPRELEELARSNPDLQGIDNPFGIGIPHFEQVAEGVLGFCTLLIAFSALAAAASIVIRFRRARGIERQQLKWFAYAASLLAAFFLLNVLGYAVSEEDLGGVTISEETVEASGALTIAGLFGLPLAAAIAIVRYRLYEIDRIINRTLVYALLTAGLAVTYAGVVVALQALLRPVSGGSDLAIVVTTLVVAALFVPARRRVQDAVDRRFNRRAYDAARTVETFSARLREQIDLDTLRYELLAVVDNTMQPARVSLWLRGS
jgi:hypothetical protein